MLQGTLGSTLGMSEAPTQEERRRTAGGLQVGVKLWLRLKGSKVHTNHGE